MKALSIQIISNYLSLHALANKSKNSLRDLNLINSFPRPQAANLQTYKALLFLLHLLQKVNHFHRHHHQTPPQHHRQLTQTRPVPRQARKHLWRARFAVIKHPVSDRDIIIMRHVPINCRSSSSLFCRLSLRCNLVRRM